MVYIMFFLYLRCAVQNRLAGRQAVVQNGRRQAETGSISSGCHVGAKDSVKTRTVLAQMEIPPISCTDTGLPNALIGAASVARKQNPAVRVQKTTMSKRVSGKMDDCYTAVFIQRKHLPVIQRKK